MTSTGVRLAETKMRKTIVAVLGALLIAGSAAQAATAAEHHVRDVYRAPVGEQFRNANNSIDGRASTWCSTEPGNPYNPQTDYLGWSSWRQLGAWDSRNDCQ
jgi:hypothetical protein